MRCVSSCTDEACVAYSQSAGEAAAAGARVQRAEAGNMTLRCMQALMRVQMRMRDQRMRLSQEPLPADAACCSSKPSYSVDMSTFWDSKYTHKYAERRCGPV